MTLAPHPRNRSVDPSPRGRECRIVARAAFGTTGVTLARGLEAREPRPRGVARGRLDPRVSDRRVRRGRARVGACAKRAAPERSACVRRRGDGEGSLPPARGGARRYPSPRCASRSRSSSPIWWSRRGWPATRPRGARGISCSATSSRCRPWSSATAAGREVHRRRRDGGVRRTGRARGRCAARRARRGRDARDARDAQSGSRADLGRPPQRRVGINSGEVVAGRAPARPADGDGSGRELAKRLEEAAATSEILISEATHRLVRDAVVAERVVRPRREARRDGRGAAGSSRSCALAPGRARRFDSPLVGREQQLSALRSVVRERRAESHLPPADRARAGRDRQVAPRPGVRRTSSARRRRCCTATACPTARASRTGR